MKTTIYFVRHAEPNYRNHDDFNRELTEKGMKDSLKVTHFFLDKKIDKVYSSPYKRAVDTVKDLADKLELPLQIEQDFRERKIDSVWIEDFNAFAKKQWENFSYRLSDGESLNQVQERNIRALEAIISKHPGQNLVVASHGTALSTIVNHYQSNFKLEQFQQIKHLFPFIVRFDFVANSCQSITLYDILQETIHETPLL
ncbi:histidine phosphatase family protein [Streptococcus merionis]|uniref:histidine phosphatase family protein n=1 Tax=Streptococcus merionis TaxID=400065 RepID=UPI003511B5B7